MLARVTLFHTNCLPTSFPTLFVNENNTTMPIIAAVVAHRRCAKQQQTLSTKSFSTCTPVTTPSSIVKASNFPLFSGKAQLFQSKSVSFSTTAKSFKSKLNSVFNQSLSRLVSSDHEESRRFYVKGRDRTQGNKKTNIKVNEEQMAELIDVESYKAQLEELSAQLKEDFTKQLSIRNSSGALETLSVQFEGDVYPLEELAQIGRKNPQLAVLNLSSLPDALQPVLTALQNSGMNLNPQQDGTTIYVPLPKVTREHRENLARNAKTLNSKYKAAYQTLQNRFIKSCRNQKEGVSEDLLYSVQQQIMKLAADYIQEAESLTQAKSKELLGKD